MKKDYLARSLFCQMFVYLGLYTPPPRHKTPFTYVAYVYSDISLSYGHLGSREETSKNKLKYASFIFPMTHNTI